MKKLIALVAMFAFVVSVTLGSDIAWKAADESVAFTVKNTSTGAVTVVIQAGATTGVVTIGSVSTTIVLSGSTADTIGELATVIAACTNAAGDKPLTVDQSMALSADSVNAKLLAGTYTAAANGGTCSVLWDTSTCLFYSLYIPKSGTLKMVYGDPLGTGNLTMKIYSSGSLVYNQLMTTNDNALLEEDFGLVGLPVDRPIIRLIRATTATTGNAGAVLVQ